jgi:hypothetical protein
VNVICLQACQILKELFPNFKPLSTDAELCAVCDALLHISKVDKLEVRRRVEDEKAGLSPFDCLLKTDLQIGETETHAR